MQVRLSPEAALLLTILRRELDRCLMRHAHVEHERALTSRPAEGQGGQGGQGGQEGHEGHEGQMELGCASQAVVDAARALLARH